MRDVSNPTAICYAGHDFCPVPVEMALKTVYLFCFCRHHLFGHVHLLEYRLLRCESSNPQGSSDGQESTPQAVIPHCDRLGHIAVHLFQQGAFTTQQVSTRFSKIAMTTIWRHLICLPAVNPSCISSLKVQRLAEFLCHRVSSPAGLMFGVAA